MSTKDNFWQAISWDIFISHIPFHLDADDKGISGLANARITVMPGTRTLITKDNLLLSFHLYFIFTFTNILSLDYSPGIPKDFDRRKIEEVISRAQSLRLQTKEVIIDLQVKHLFHLLQALSSHIYLELLVILLMVLS